MEAPPTPQPAAGQIHQHHHHDRHNQDHGHCLHDHGHQGGDHVKKRLFLTGLDESDLSDPLHSAIAFAGF